MPKRSAGVLLFRRTGPQLEVLLAHPGGPFWKNKDDGAWSIPKGEYGENEDPLTAAKRELAEETGLTPSGDFIPLGEIRQPVHSNAFSMPWPPGSGKLQEFPEIDRAEWFLMEIARRKILKGQAELLERLAKHLHRP